MLIYTNHLTLEPEDGANSVLTLLAEWLSWKTKEPINIPMLLSDITERTYREQGVLQTSHCPTAKGAFGFKADYSHVDSRIPTRRWTTEIELHQAEHDHCVECTVSVSVVDQMRVKGSKPMSSRPRLLVDIVEKCRPVGSTPGLFAKDLTLATCEKFLTEVNRIGRQTPIVVFSCKADGQPIIESDRLREQLLGLAEIYFIPPHADVSDLATAIGTRMMADEGAARILYPISDSSIPSLYVLPYNRDGSDRTRREMEDFICQKLMRRNAASKTALMDCEDSA
jgi:hypothetical protein